MRPRHQLGEFRVHIVDLEHDRAAQTRWRGRILPHGLRKIARAQQLQPRRARLEVGICFAACVAENQRQAHDFVPEAKRRREIVNQQANIIEVHCVPFLLCADALSIAAERDTIGPQLWGV